MRSAILIAHRLIFVALLGFTLFHALEPGASGVGGLSDKFWHFLAFYVLSLSAACAAPRLNLALLAGAMLGFGLVIEGLQRLPAIGRSASLLDVLAGVAGICAALLPALVMRWRARCSRPGGGD
ncbi:hypothetical protein [Phenylobacterium sp.]|uniref:hypothetical protein n=1 Tax=Phenylobacterium sp. TaxID=1871053 RepID=UPI002E32527C|nr:hypothetical protein [Phenylobacterium sp.]HEX2562239.1 hypothetical protein [Phenylobacterium sp.]